MRASSRPSWLSGPSAQCVRVEEVEEPSGCCVSGEWLKKTGPSFNMWFSSVQAEWKSSRFIALIGIQCSINITHPLIRSCCVCLHMLRAMWTGSYGPFSLVVGGNFLEQGLCCSEEMKDLSLKICHFQTLKKLMHSKVFCLYSFFNFDTLREVKRCCTSHGKVQRSSIWMSAWLHSHKQRLP